MTVQQKPWNNQRSECIFLSPAFCVLLICFSCFFPPPCPVYSWLPLIVNHIFCKVQKPWIALFIWAPLSPNLKKEFKSSLFGNFIKSQNLVGEKLEKEIERQTKVMFSSAEEMAHMFRNVVLLQETWVQSQLPEQNTCNHLLLHFKSI